MQYASDRWVSITGSVLLHGALLAALMYGWLLFYHKPPPLAPTLAIEAQVVDERAVRGALQPAPPQPPPPQPPPPQEVEPLPPPPPPPESAGPPQPTPEELAQREAQQRQQAQAAAAEQARQRAAEQQAAQEAARKVEEQRKARQAAEAQKRATEQQHKAEELDSSEREEDLQRSLAAESQARTARSGPALTNWEAQIAAKITRAWIRPPTARSGIECMLHVTQVPGGEVTQVSIGDCNGDQAVRESIEAAVYRASPLPPPPCGRLPSWRAVRRARNSRLKSPPGCAIRYPSRWCLSPAPSRPTAGST
jgi:colicin import membrane protein